MQLFGAQFNEDTGYSALGAPISPDADLLPLPRYNFDYFVPAMLTVFVIMTGSWYALHGACALQQCELSMCMHARPGTAHRA